MGQGGVFVLQKSDDTINGSNVFFPKRINAVAIGAKLKVKFTYMLKHLQQALAAEQAQDNVNTQIGLSRINTFGI